ncbi:MAG: type II toxin-antitoxin system RelE/ParE family toxin [bacterium]
MKVDFKESFAKDLRKIKDRKLLASVQGIIEQTETAESLREIKKLKGYKIYYRIKVGNYRIGIKFENDLLTFVRFLSRKDISL